MIIILLAIAGLPLIVVLLPAIMFFRFGNYRHGVKIAVAVSNRWPYCLQYLRLPYDFAVWRAGGIPVTVGPADLPRLKEILKNVSGIILTGGEDIDPQLHNGIPNAPALFNSTRDELELKILKLNRELDLPLLGICRGTQLLVVSRSGKLESHDHHWEKLKRHSTSLLSLGKHNTIIHSGTELREIIKSDSIKVISIHHHAAAASGKLRISAVAEDDDCIEAVECPEAYWTLGVQWHPELQAPFNRKHQALFNTLVKKSREIIPAKN
jgi:putative glutamine amidotransferase